MLYPSHPEQKVALEAPVSAMSDSKRAKFRAFFGGSYKHFANFVIQIPTYIKMGPVKNAGLSAGTLSLILLYQHYLRAVNILALERIASDNVREIIVYCWITWVH